MRGIQRRLVVRRHDRRHEAYNTPKDSGRIALHVSEVGESGDASLRHRKLEYGTLTLIVEGC